MPDWTLAAQIQPPQIQTPAQMAQGAAQIRALQTQNALRSILSQPDALDKDGMPSSNALKQLYAVDPGVASGIQQNALKSQGMKSELWQQQHDMIYKSLTPAVEQYEDDLKKGIPQEVAQRNAQKVYTEALGGLGKGPFSQDQIKAMPPDFNYPRIMSGMMSYEQRTRMAMEQRKTTDYERNLAREERQGDERLAMERERVDIARQAAGGKEFDKPTELQIDGKPVLAQQDKKTGQWVTADEKRAPISADEIRRSADVRQEASAGAERAAMMRQYKTDNPNATDADAWRAVERDMGMAKLGASPEAMDSTAKLIASYQQAPLSGFAMSRGIGSEIMSRVLKYNPDYQASRFAEVNRAMSDFGTGKTGNTIRSLNVGIQHLETIDEAAKALKNGNIQLFNSLGNRLAEETGNPAPTTFDGLKQIVGTEIEKAIAGGIGASADREALMKSLQSKNSPDQLLQMTEGFRRLMAGQAMGLKKQYEDSTGFKSGPFAFEGKLMPATIKALGNISGETSSSKDTKSAIPVLKSKADYDKLPSGAKYRKEGDPENRYRIKP